MQLVALGAALADPGHPGQNDSEKVDAGAAFVEGPRCLLLIFCVFLGFAVRFRTSIVRLNVSLWTAF